MNALTVGRIKEAIKKLPDDMVVILGDDEELNGVHLAFFIQTEDLTDQEESSSIYDLVKQTIDIESLDNQTVLMIS